MIRYSIFSLARNALAHRRDWPRAWRSPRPRPSYDVAIVGGGGHGLATAYYLAKEHDVGSIAVLENGWLGGLGLCRAADGTVEWDDPIRDLDRLRDATVEKDGKRVTTRTPVSGQVGRVFQAAGIALPPNWREHSA